MRSEEDLMSLDSDVEELIFDNGVLNSRSFTVLNLTRFVNVKRIVIGDLSFEYVRDVFMNGLTELESVVVGEKSFSEDWGISFKDKDLNHHFYLSNCSSLREIRIGDYSFANYAVFDVSDLPSLEVMEIGNIETDKSYSFSLASLELKGESVHKE